MRQFITNKYVVASCVVLLILITDQFSKIWIKDFLSAYPQGVALLPFFNLVEVYNFGISFGLFQNLGGSHWPLTILALILVLVLLWWLYKASHIMIHVALGLIIGGALGNVIDRVRIGAVFDFLDFHIAGYHWPAFNVADSSIFIGVVILLLEPFWLGTNDEETH